MTTKEPTKKRKPSLKQKKAFTEMVENGGSISKAMVAAGYSENTARSPQKMTETEGWKQLLNEYLPDSLLAQKHLELLNKQEVITKNNMTTGEVDVIPTGEIDVAAVAKGLDMAYKLKGSYSTEALPPVQTQTVNIFYQPLIKAKVEELEDSLKAQFGYVRKDQTGV